MEMYVYYLQPSTTFCVERETGRGREDCEIKRTWSTYRGTRTYKRFWHVL